MDHQLQDALTAFIQQLQNGVNFSVQQAPAIIQQWLRFAIITDILLIGLYVLIDIGIVLFIKWVHFRKFEDDDIAPLAKGFTWAFGIIVFIVITSALICNLYDLLEIWIAPKVWIIQQISSLLHHHQ